MFMPSFLRQRVDIISSQEALEKNNGSVEGIADDGDEDPHREVWDSPVEFVLGCLGYAVGLSNIWRFPYLCYINGGGAFLIPYFLMLILVGFPVFFQEVVIGQYSGLGPMHIWNMCPIFQGTGLSMIFLSSMLVIFYCMVLGWAIHFFGMSFQKVLPWSHCNHDYNTEFCYSKAEAKDCEQDNTTIWFNQTCYNSTIDSMKEHIANRSSASEEYFNRDVLQISGKIEETGRILWQLVLVLAIGWLLCAGCLIKGIRSAGKVVYFTALFPYVVLFIMMIRGATLSGSLEGVKFYITPQWEKLSEPKVWADAAGQIFFSLSVGGGGLMTYASYNKFYNNIYRDALIVSIGNCLTSVFAGFITFSILGYMSQELNKPVSEVVDQGPALAFVVYPTAVAQLPIPQLWSVLFFFMLITLGLDSLFAGVETVITAIVDAIPKLRSKKWVVVITMCTLFWLLGLPMCTNAGQYWVGLIADASTTWALIVVAFVEMLVFNWFYGALEMKKNVEEMCGFKLWYHWLVIWYLAPIVLMVILAWNLISAPDESGKATWAIAIKMCIATAPILFIIIGAIYVIIKYTMAGRFKCKTHMQKLAILFLPNDLWVPSYVLDPMKVKIIDKEIGEILDAVSHNEKPVCPLPQIS